MPIISPIYTSDRIACWFSNDPQYNWYVIDDFGNVSQIDLLDQYGYLADWEF
jgi:hypothetical protein